MTARSGRHGKEKLCGYVSAIAFHVYRHPVGADTPVTTAGLVFPAVQGVSSQRVKPPWPLVPMLPIAASPKPGQVQSRAASRVRSPGSSTDVVALPAQPTLTGSGSALGEFRQREHGRPPRGQTL